MNINNNFGQIYVFFFFKLCKWHLEQHPESPWTVFNLKLMFTECIKLLAEISKKLKNNTDIRACSLSVNQMRMRCIITATAEYSFIIILGPIR